MKPPFLPFQIADFGLSNVYDGKDLLNTFCGSPLYASPEIVKGLPYQGPEVDCWSLGVLLYTLVSFTSFTSFTLNFDLFTLIFFRFMDRCHLMAPISKDW